MNIRAFLKDELKDSARPLIYMSEPTHFGVDYVINPWMEGQIGNANAPVAKHQWTSLRRILSSLTEVRTISCDDAKLPDVTFVANAGSYLPTSVGYTFFPATFRNVERKPEESFFIQQLPYKDLRRVQQIFEGDGDLLRLRDHLIIGYGHRTNLVAVNEIAAAIDADSDDMLAVQLVDKRFYHLDTCFFYHNHGSEDFCMYFPDAFTRQSLATLRRACIELNVNVLEVNEKEAEMMVCNAVGIGDVIVAHDFSERIRQWLFSRGFKTMTTPLYEFHKAGGSAKCLTLRVPRAAVE